MYVIIKILLISLFVAMPVCAYANQIDETPATDNWTLLTNTYKAYLHHPSDDNATRVTALVMALSDSKINGSNKEAAIQFIYSNKGVLVRNIEAGEIRSVELAYSLLLITDGGFSEDLLVTIGKLSRITPQLFLGSLNAAITKNIINSCEFITMLGQEYTDNDGARCLEKEKRINSLAKVRAPELSVIKNRCLSVLHSSVNDYCSEQ